MELALGLYGKAQPPSSINFPIALLLVNCPWCSSTRLASLLSSMLRDGLDTKSSLRQEH